MPGVFSTESVLPLEFKPDHGDGHLLTRDQAGMENKAERKGGVLQALGDHFAKVYRFAPVAA